MADKTKLADLELLLGQATEAFKSAEKAESQARSAATDAKNRLNAAQKDFDKYVDGMRGQAPRDTEWKQVASETAPMIQNQERVVDEPRRGVPSLKGYGGHYGY